MRPRVSFAKRCKFPEIAFGQLMLAVELAEHFANLEEIIVDVDEKHVEQAIAVWQELKQKLFEMMTSHGWPL